MKRPLSLWPEGGAAADPLTTHLKGSALQLFLYYCVTGTQSGQVSVHEDVCMKRIINLFFISGRNSLFL